MTAKRLVPSFVRTFAVSIGLSTAALEVMAVMRAHGASGASKLFLHAAATKGKAGK